MSCAIQPRLHGLACAFERVPSSSASFCRSGFLVLLVGPSLHHVAELHDSLGVVAAEVTVDVLRTEAVLEAVDDILISDVANGGTHLEKHLV
jgi:hypothetical protein